VRPEDWPDDPDKWPDSEPLDMDSKQAAEEPLQLPAESIDTSDLGTGRPACS